MQRWSYGWCRQRRDQLQPHQGNLGGAADGGGIALRNVNGQDVQDNLRGTWWLVDINNNIIVNIVRLGGGGISFRMPCG